MLEDLIQDQHKRVFRAYKGLRRRRIVRDLEQAFKDDPSLASRFARIAGRTSHPEYLQAAGRTAYAMMEHVEMNKGDFHSALATLSPL